MQPTCRYRCISLHTIIGAGDAHLRRLVALLACTATSFVHLCVHQTSFLSTVVSFAAFLFLEDRALPDDDPFRVRSSFFRTTALQNLGRIYWTLRRADVEHFLFLSKPHTSQRCTSCAINWHHFDRRIISTCLTVLISCRDQTGDRHISPNNHRWICLAAPQSSQCLAHLNLLMNELEFPPRDNSLAWPP